MANVIITLDHPKCVRIVEDTRMGQTPNTYEHQRVHEFMIPLIERLAKARPFWEFHSLQNYSSRRDDQNRIAYYARFTVMEDGDNLGWIDCENRHHGMTYMFDNHRLSAKRTRGQCTTTIKLDSAFKQIIDSMYGLTVDERIDTARQNLSSQTQQAVGRASRPVREARQKLALVFEKMALRHWDEFMATLNDTGKGIAVPFREQVETEAQMIALDKARTDGTGVIVVIKGDSYFVGTQGNPVTNTRYTTDTLPAGIKANLGILKLTEVNTPFPNIGMKTHKDQYLVVLDKDEISDL